MKLPKQNELIRVFNKHYPEGKLRYFKKKSPDPESPICVYANGQTKETNDGGLEYWDRWEYPEPPFSTCKFSIYNSLEDAEMGKISNFKLYKKILKTLKKEYVQMY